MNNHGVSPESCKPLQGILPVNPAHLYHISFAKTMGMHVWQ